MATTPITTPRPKSKGITRFFAQLPTYIYRVGLGGLLGDKRMMVTHRGRKSGLKRYTVLAVRQHNPQIDEYITVSALGERADWYRNIQTMPALEIQVGHRRFFPELHFLTTEETIALLEPVRRDPKLARRLARYAGYSYDGTQEQFYTICQAVRAVGFRPATHAQANQALRF